MSAILKLILRTTFWQTEFIGKDGLEKMYGDKIQGINGGKIVEQM